ncbi:MAG: lipocalin family protein [Myxococcota bacterium]
MPNPSASRGTRRLLIRAIVPFLTALALVGCTGTPEGVTVVRGFELDRYLGTWYEVARLDHPFERGLTNVTATYRLRADGGVDVVNAGFDPEENERKSADGRAYFVDEPSIGRLKVSFFGPFYGGYNVIALDRDDYAWSVVAGPNRSYLWILARAPDMDPALYERLTAEARALGFPVDDLIRVVHAPRDASATP